MCQCVCLCLCVVCACVCLLCLHGMHVCMCSYMHIYVVQANNLMNIVSYCPYIITDSRNAKELFQQFDQCSNRDRTCPGHHCILHTITTTGN